jgi:hypothetical protein
LTHSYKVKQRVEQYYFGSDHVDEQANRWVIGCPKQD